MLQTIAIGVAALILLAIGAKWLSGWYSRRQVSNALDGEYGKETKWAAELSKEGDQLFEMAATELDQSELMEIGIVAESKEELRELTVERFEESADERIPNDFAQ